MTVPVKATVMWAFLNKQNDMSGKYQVDLCHLSDKAVTALEDIGLKVNNKEDKGFFITCKSNHPIKAYDDKGREMESDVIVGNGSEVVATVGFYEWSFKGKKGVSPSLKKLKISKLVEYVAPDGESVDPDEDVL
jgi:hypothetical protein